jgi:hypothetical protein
LHFGEISSIFLQGISYFLFKNEGSGVDGLIGL